MQQHRTKRWHWGWWLLLSSILVLLHLSAGPSALLHWPLTGTEQIILLELRLPRLVLAIIAGAGLAIAGAILQILLRNPLAEPSILGVGQSASVVVVAILYFQLLGTGMWQGWLLPWFAFGGALLGLALVLWLGARRSTMQLLLAGIAVGMFASALMALLLNLAPSPFAYQEWSLWMLGSLAHRSWQDVLILTPGLLLAIWVVVRQQPFLQALVLSEATVQTLGFNVQRHRNQLFIATALLSGCLVVSVGLIGFIGLMAPHIARQLGLSQPRQLILASAWLGALLLLLCDALAQWLPTPNELQVGVVTALIGTPILVLLLQQQTRASSDA